MIYRDTVIEFPNPPHAEVRPGAFWNQIARGGYDIGAGEDDRSGSIVSSLLWRRQRFCCYRDLSTDPPPASIDAGDRRWIAKLTRPVAGVDLVIGGHTTLRERMPVRFGPHLFIDTASYVPQDCRLTAVNTDAGMYWQVVLALGQQWAPLPLPTLFENRLPPHILRRRSR